MQKIGPNVATINGRRRKLKKKKKNEKKNITEQSYLFRPSSDCTNTQVDTRTKYAFSYRPTIYNGMHKRNKH